jgi:hypothetical protein
MDPGYIQIHMPPVDAERALEIIGHVTPAFERLWATGRLRALTDSSEGRATVAAFERSWASARSDLMLALSSGEANPAIRVGLPKREARAVLAFMRRLFGLAADEEAMAAVGVAPLPPEDRAYAEPYFVHAEATIAAAGKS